MWYLIAPPIVVVTSLLFVLWYLSRRGAEPAIANKVSQLENEEEQKISFFRTKSFFLRTLEKTAYRFKVGSLRLHNAMSNVTQSLKKKRNRFEERDKERTELEKETRAASAAPSSQASVNEKSSSQIETREPSRVHQFGDRISREKMETEETVSRPMVSERMVHPEVPYQKTQADISREERLIARIGANPKDFASYESLGDYYLEIGNVKDAKECYRQVLKLSPAERMVKIKIRRLEKIFLQRGQ